MKMKFTYHKRKDSCLSHGPFWLAYLMSAYSEQLLPLIHDISSVRYVFFYDGLLSRVVLILYVSINHFSSKRWVSERKIVEADLERKRIL